MFEHVTSKFAFAVKCDITDLAHMRLFLLAPCDRVFAGSCFRDFVFVPFPEVQGSIVQIVVKVIAYNFILPSSLNAIFISLVAITFLGAIILLLFC